MKLWQVTPNQSINEALQATPKESINGGFEGYSKPIN